jgi:hypothetical protein
MKKSAKKNTLIIIGIILVLVIIFLFLKKSIKIIPTPTEIGCKKAGCSNSLCVEADKENIITTCEWKEEYGCYQKAKCERQKDGTCGFTKDEEFNNCIDKLMPKIKNLKEI